MSYFNELSGGPKKGYMFFADQNIDYDQDRQANREYGRKFKTKSYVQNSKPEPGIYSLQVKQLRIKSGRPWVLVFEPDEYIGYSHLIFNVSEEDVRNLEKGNITPRDNGWLYNLLMRLMDKDPNMVHNSIITNYSKK